MKIIYGYENDKDTHTHTPDERNREREKQKTENPKSTKKCDGTAVGGKKMKTMKTAYCRVAHKHQKYYPPFDKVTQLKNVMYGTERNDNEATNMKQ